MASPFRLFRKHQKAFLAVAAVFAMFIFVVGDAIMGCAGSGSPGRSGSPNQVVTSWDGGSLRAHELDLLRERRYFLNEFLSHVYGLGRARAEATGETALEPTVPTFFLSQNAQPAEVMGQCVEERVLADQAREAGMSVSDIMINDFIRKTGLQRVTDEDIRSILENVRRYDMRTSEEWLFSGLRELLLGNIYANSVSAPVMGVAPVQAWNDWKQINDRIALDAAILPTDKFMAEVPDPSEAQLIAFYEQYKDRIGGVPVTTMGVQLPSPEPGFREPRRVKLKYLMGDVTAWTQEKLASVTDEEIADYYERNKRAEFVKTDSDDIFGEDDEEDADPNRPEDEPAKEEEEEEGNVAEKSDGEDASEEADPNKGEEADEDEADDDVEYEPLDKVKDDIRNQLANQMAVVELKQVMEAAYGDLTTVFNRYGGEVVAAEAEQKETPPIPDRLADLAPLAKEKKLIFEETVPLSDRELYETMVGKAMDVQSGRINVTQAAFLQLRPYEPFLAQDLDGYWYLVLKTEDIESRVPELKEIREQVAAAWKRQQAAQAALKKSEEMAKAAQESGKSLTDQFADSGYETTTTDLFSWITFGNTPVEMRQGPRLGDAPPLTAVGPEFMQRAFLLKPDEVIGLLNFDQSQAYVLKLARHERTEDELRRAFLNDVNNSQAMQIMEAIRSQNNQRVLLGQILNRVNLDVQSLQRYLQGGSGE